MTLHDLLAKALSLHQAGAMAKARALYELVIVHAPAAANALHLYGVLRRRADGDLDTGIRLMRRVIALDPGFTEARINLANMLTCHERLDEAIKALEDLLRTEPNHRGGLHTLAKLLLLQQRWDEAVECLEVLLRLEPGHEEARWCLNLAYRGRPRVDIVESALALGNEHHRADRLMDAEMAYRQVLKANPGHIRTLVLFAELAAQTGRPGLAAYLADRALALSPADADVRRRRDRLRAAARAA